MNKENMEEWFDDIFDEFLYELKDVDLSEGTISHLEDIFEKDKKLFFKRYEKELEGWLV